MSVGMFSLCCLYVEKINPLIFGVRRDTKNSKKNFRIILSNFWCGLKINTRQIKRYDTKYETNGYHKIVDA